MFILLQLMKGNTCEIGAAVDSKYKNAPNIQIDVYVLIMTKKRHEMQNFPHDGSELGSFVLVLLNLFKLFYFIILLCRVTAVTL